MQEFGKLKENLHPRMALPEQIPVQYTEDSAGYVSMRPVVKQMFRLNELADMVVGVVGKDAEQVRKVFRTGKVAYNGYSYWWEPLSAEVPEIAALIAGFPEDDPSRPFEASRVTSVVFESGGGAQTSTVEISARDAGRKRLFRGVSPWNVLLEFAGKNPPRYERYAHERRADLYRLTLGFEDGRQLLAGMLIAAPRTLRRRWSSLRPPAVLTFVCSR